MFGNVVEAGWASVHVSASIRVEPFGFLGVLGQVLLGGMRRVALEFQAQSYRVSPLLIIADAVGARGSRRGAGRLGSVGRRRLTESLSIALKALGVVEQRVQGTVCPQDAVAAKGVGHCAGGGKAASGQELTLQTRCGREEGGI